jgi:hypothetical protein
MSSFNPSAKSLMRITKWFRLKPYLPPLNLGYGIMHRDHPLSARDFIDFEDLSNTSLITHAKKEKDRYSGNLRRPCSIVKNGFQATSQG